MARQSGRALKRITLENDYGGQITFTGHLEGETINYNEASGELVSEKIFKSEQDRTGYSVVVAKENHRERRAYLMECQNESCMISNGSIILGIDTDILLTFLGKALDEEAENQAEDSLNHIRKQLQAANE